MPADQPISLKSLAKITHLLNQSPNDEKRLWDVLGEIGRTVHAEIVTILKKYYVNQDNFILKCLGSWKSPEIIPHSENFWPEFLRSEDLPKSFWERLEFHETVTSNESPWPALKGLPKTFFVPLFLEDQLFGFLTLSNVKGKSLDPVDQNFLSAICGILELWISKLNLEKRMKDIVNFVPHPILIMDANQVVTGWSKSSEEMTGWEARRIIGKGNYEQAIPYYGERRPTVSNLILKPDPKWEATYPEFRREGNTVFSLAYCPSVPGGAVYIRCKTSLIYDVNNHIWGNIHMVEDVTRKRKIEENLHRSESMYRAITDFAGVGIMFFRKNNIFYYNEHFAELLGISEKKITLNHLTKWIHPDDREKVFGHFENLFKKYRDPLRFEFRAQKSNDMRYYRAYAQIMEYEDQPSIHFILDDITEQKELIEKARQDELRLYHEDRLTALGIMAAGIAHELNQPLNTIRVMTEGLLFGREEGWKLNEEQIFYSLEMVSRQAVRMSEVIQNIRNFAREDREQTVDDVNANEAIENVFSMMGRQLEAHGIQVEKDLATRLPPIKTTLNRLEQVIMNLVVNSRQALDSCSHDHKKLRVRTGAENGSVSIEVSDNATGIPEDLMVKIFDPFFTTKEVGKGTGLGLSICQSIVAEFKGQIKVFNNEVGGATFVVSTPVNGG